MRPRSAPAALALALLLVLTACGSDDGEGASGNSGGTTRTVLVDYNHDEVAASFLKMYPRNVTMTPGDTVVFKQAWTGEPHTVTFGTLFDDLTKISPEIRKWIEDGGEDPFESLPKETQQRIEKQLEETLPWALGDDGVQQNAGQPCYLDAGAPPKDPKTPCPKREQPAFNGRQAYYSSGIIPYQGDQGNRFEVPLADDIAPGTYAYYCAIHGPGQSGVVNVKEKGAAIPSQSEVDRQARREISADAKPLLDAREAAEDGRFAIEGEKIEGNLAGFISMTNPDAFHAFGSEFIPGTITTRVGQKVKWNIVGGHTISFVVPRYLPILTFGKDGRVEMNPKVSDPQGGWPGGPEDGPPDGEAPPEGEAPPTEGEAPPEGGEGEGGGGPPDDGPPPEIDAGHWDGSGFVSSGVIFEGIYSVTFDKAGRYKYACLIHPRMVGEVVVR